MKAICESIKDIRVNNKLFLQWYKEFTNKNKDNVSNLNYKNIFISNRENNHVYRNMSIGFYLGYKIYVSKSKLIAQIIKFNEVISEIDYSKEECSQTPYEEVLNICSILKDKIREYDLSGLDNAILVGGCKNIELSDELKEIAVFYIPEIMVYGLDSDLSIFYVTQRCNKEFIKMNEVNENSNIVKIAQEKTTYYPSKELYFNKIKEVINSLQNEEIDKVVIAKKCEISTNQAINEFNLSKYLLEEYFQQYFYYFQLGEKEKWIGVSPEVLLVQEDNIVETKPLAGTFAKSIEKEKNNMIRQKLSKDKKELLEHTIAINLMINDIKNNNLGKVYLEEEKEIIETPYAFHLKSKIKIELNNGVNDFNVLGSIYPPATIWGIPRKKCGKYIYRVENFDREYFSGFFGVSDSRGFSDFALVIRSAKIEDRKLSLFAGGGIVKLSVPESEWNETDTKMKPFLNYFK